MGSDVVEEFEGFSGGAQISGDFVERRGRRERVVGEKKSTELVVVGPVIVVALEESYDLGCECRVVGWRWWPRCWLRWRRREGGVGGEMAEE